MKHLRITNLLLFFFFLVKYLELSCQENLIPNASFEQGFQNVGCLYAPSNFGKNSFNSTISWWKVATHPNYGVPDWYDSNNSGCMDWLDYYHCNPSLSKFLPSVFPSQKFLLLNSKIQQTNVEKKYVRDAVRTSFMNNNKLLPNKMYSLRLKVVPIDNGVTPPITDGYNCELRVFFTKFSEHWSSNSNNNEKWECYNCNISIQNQIPCIGYNVQKEFLSPNFQNLQNIILYQQYNGFLIDDIELYEKCPISMVLQNRTFDNYFYSSLFQNGQTFIYEATDYLYVGNGNWQNTPELIVEKGADMIFRAGQGVDLLPGFTAENNLDVYIAPCGGGNRLALDTTEHPNTQFSFNENESPFLDIPDISVYPNPSTGIFIIGSEETLNIQDIEVYDIFGKRIQIMPGWLDSRIQVNLSGYSKGLYLLRIGAFSQRLVLE